MSKAPYSGANTRRNIVAFLIGKVPTALLTATILGMSARILTATEFGYVVLMMAMLEVVLGLSTLGLDWVLLRYAPVYRVHGARAGLGALIGAVALARGLILSALATAALGLGSAALLFGSDFPPALLPAFGVLLVTEGVMRIFRDNALEALALQSRLQLILIAKNVTIVAALFYFDARGHATAADMLLAETVAAALSLLLAGYGVLAAVRSVAPGPREWDRPTPRQFARVALLNYASGVVEYVYSPSFLILLLGRFQPAAAIAGVGFVLRLVDIIRNYLPGMLVFGLVRSRMIGAYVSGRDYGELRMWAQFLFKISLLTLLPVFGAALVYGEQLLRLASADRYSSYFALFAVLCFWLGLRLHRHILGVVFNAIELMHVWARASLLSLLLLPVLFFLGRDHWGVWFVAVALYGNELLVNFLAVRSMRRRGYAWTVSAPWLAKALLALALGCAPSWWVPGAPTLALAAGVVLLSCVYAVAALCLGVFDDNDRRLVNRSLGRKLFKDV